MLYRKTILYFYGITCTMESSLYRIDLSVKRFELNCFEIRETHINPFKMSSRIEPITW